MDLLSGTPWWVYLIFLYLLWIGFQASKPRKIPLRRLFILPLLLTVWSLYGLFLRMDGRYGYFVVWIVALLVGGALGWVWVRKWKATVNWHEKTINLPGSWSVLIFVLIIFVAKYWFGYTYSVNPESVYNPTIFLSDAIISGFITGIFVGRVACFCTKKH